jgi:vitamin B12 transporter
MFTRYTKVTPGRHLQTNSDSHNTAASDARPINTLSRHSKLVSKPVVCVIAVAIVLFSLSIATASTHGGDLVGSVIDPSGAKIPGARVLLRDETGVIVYQSRSGSDGQFSFSNIAEGKYRLSVEAAGFIQPRIPIVDVRSGARENIEVRLEVAAISDQLVITATRTEALKNEFGGSIDVISAEDLNRENQSSVSEALRSVPGLAVVQSGGRGAITSIFSRGGESDYNKVLIDGVPVNRAGGGFDFAFLTTENVERIEIARGPQTAPLGSDAMTSAIQLITRRGSTPTPEFEFSGEGGSFDSHRETARLSGLARWFDYSTSFGYSSTDGRVPNSDYINRSASANLGFRLASPAELRITARSNNNTLGVAGPTAMLFSDPDARQKHRDIGIGATLNLKTTNRFHQSARFVYSEFDTNNFDPVAQDLTQPGTPPLPPFSFGADFASTFKDHQKRSGVHYQGIVTINNSNLLTAGLDFEHESAVIDSSNDFSRARVSPSRNNLGIYVQDQWAWSDRVYLTAGVRIEHNTGDVPDDLRAVLQSLGSSAPSGDVGFGFAANPKVAISFVARRHRDDAVFGATRLKGSFGTGIKEPTLDESFGPSIFALGNPSLDPERTISFDATLVQEFLKRRLSVEVTYFDNHFRDLITFESTANSEPIRLPDGTLTNFVNADRASGRGIEITTSGRPGGALSRLRVNGSYTYLRSRLDEAADVLTFPPPTFEGVFVANPELGLPLLRRPKHSGSFDLSWIDQRYDVTLEGLLVGERRDFIPFPFAKFDANGRPIFNDGYARLNFAGSYRPTKWVDVFARIENLLNEDYQEVLGFPAYRLNFTAGLRFRVGGSK